MELDTYNQEDYFICKYCNNKSKDNSNYCIHISATIKMNEYGWVYYCLDCLDRHDQELELEGLHA